MKVCADDWTAKRAIIASNDDDFYCERLIDAFPNFTGGIRSIIKAKRILAIDESALLSHALLWLP